MAETIDGTKREGEGEDDGNNDIRLDPFLQPPILKAFFEQLPLEDLAKCRLVSKLWYEESLSTWRSNVTLKFGKEGIVSIRDDGSSSTTSPGEFLDLWEAGEWGLCPYKRFDLSWWNFKAEDVEQTRFLKLVGGHITSLTFMVGTLIGRDHFRRIIYQAFPKLQFLKIQYSDFKTATWLHDYRKEEILVYQEPTFGVHGLRSLEIFGFQPNSMMLMDMLSHFHKLKSLHLEMLESEKRAYYRNLLETIKLIRRQDRTKLPLTNFYVEFPFEFGQRTVSSIELLKLHDQLKLPLQRLKMRFYPEEDPENQDCKFNNVIIRDILQCHSSTLNYLRFVGRGLCQPFPFGFHLEKLEQLVLPSRFSDSLRFLLYTPNLRVLEICGRGDRLSISESNELFSNSPQLEIIDWALPRLTDLTFHLPVSLCNLRKLTKWMPNVERLYGLQLDDVKFSMICKNWRNLKVLMDYGTELSDEGVIGIGSALEAGDDEGSPTCPNVTRLNSLIYLRTGSSKLTSASVHEGFLKLADLTWLSLGWSTELDPEAKAALERRKIRLDL